MDIYLHGLGQDPSAWDEIINLVGNESKAPKLYGFLDDRDDFSYGNLYQGLVNYLKEFETIDRLIGLSLGAILALNYALDNPGRLGEVIIAGGQFKIPSKIIRLQVGIFKLIPKGFFERQGLKKDQLISLQKSTLGLDFSSRLKDCPTRTKILIGQKDRPNRPAADQMAKLMDKAELFVLDGGHQLNIDSPKEFAEIILL